MRECPNEPDADGWLTVELPVEPGEPAIGELLRFGPHLEVLEPADLRAELAEAIERMGAIYG
jgi:predicted DNA-binding transcriptional regulator YafY